MIYNTISETRTAAHETTFTCGWSWPDEVQLAEFVEQNVRAAKDDRAEQNDRKLENNAEYAALYFIA